MSREDLEKFLAAMERVSEANTASPEAARAFLKKEGYLNTDGTVAAAYPSAQRADTSNNSDKR